MTFMTYDFYHHAWIQMNTSRTCLTGCALHPGNTNAEVPSTSGPVRVLSSTEACPWTPPQKKDQNKTACCATVWQVGGMSANTCDAWHPNCAASHDCHRHSYSATSSCLSCSQVQSNSAKYQWVGKETVYSWRKCHFTGIKYRLSFYESCFLLLVEHILYMRDVYGHSIMLQWETPANWAHQ